MTQKRMRTANKNKGRAQEASPETQEYWEYEKQSSLNRAHKEEHQMVSPDNRYTSNIVQADVLNLEN